MKPYESIEHFCWPLAEPETKTKPAIGALNPQRASASLPAVQAPSLVRRGRRYANGRLIRLHSIPNVSAVHKGAQYL